MLSVTDPHGWLPRHQGRRSRRFGILGILFIWTTPPRTCCSTFRIFFCSAVMFSFFSFFVSLSDNASECLVVRRVRTSLFPTLDSRFSRLECVPCRSGNCKLGDRHWTGRMSAILRCFPKSSIARWRTGTLWWNVFSSVATVRDRVTRTFLNIFVSLSTAMCNFQSKLCRCRIPSVARMRVIFHSKDG